MSNNALLVVIITMLLSAFFSGMEIAFVASNKVRAEIDIARGGVINRILNTFYTHREMFISTLLIGNNIVNVIYSMAMTILLSGYINSLVGGNEAVQLLVLTLVSTIIVLIACEFIPKTVFRINPNESLRMFSLPLYTCYLLLYPISRFTQLLSAGMMRLFGVKINKAQMGIISVDELDAYLQENIDQREEELRIASDRLKILEAKEAKTLKVVDDKKLTDEERVKKIKGIFGLK